MKDLTMLLKNALGRCSHDYLTMPKVKVSLLCSSLKNLVRIRGELKTKNQKGL